MRPFAFYQQRLDAVSRSFALCIPQLEPPFRDQVALVVPAPAGARHRRGRAVRANKATAAAAVRASARLLAREPSAPDVEAFVAAFPAQLTDAERGLLGDTFELLEDAHALPPPVRSAIFSAIDRMADGMADVRAAAVAAAARRSRRRGALLLLRRRARRRAAHAPVGDAARRAARRRMSLAYHFGVFLQKVNILKDQREDEPAGRFLVPDRRELLASLRDNARGALAVHPRAAAQRARLPHVLRVVADDGRGDRVASSRSHGEPARADRRAPRAHGRARARR